jgi:hypothetical protein
VQIRQISVICVLLIRFRKMNPEGVFSCGSPANDFYARHFAHPATITTFVSLNILYHEK